MDSQLLFRLWAKMESPSGLLFQFLSTVLAPAEWLYLCLVASRRNRVISRAVTPGVPVISVGNLTVGGSGKTVFVEWLASRLGELGFHPGIVFRGYRSPSHHPRVVTSADPFQFGDEPALLSQRGFPVSIGKDRVAAMNLLLSTLSDPADCIILDDGFQYWSLRRTADLVLWDVSQGFWTHALPRGPLREPLSAVGRADAIIFSRSQNCSDRVLTSFEQIFRQNSFTGPFFRMEIYGIPEGDPPEPALYVVGTGNPGAVIQSLRWEGRVIPLIFPDHTDYNPAALFRIRGAVKRHRAKAILTTHKDLIKLRDTDPGAPVIPVNVSVVVPDEADFLRWLSERIPPPSPSGAGKSEEAS